MSVCAYCKEDVESPCLNPRDTEECPNASATPRRAGDEIHANNEDNDRD